MKLTNLETKYLGRKLDYFKKIDSTQTEIWRRKKEGIAINGEIVMADLQTKGVGTHGRVWYTDEENNIAFSTYIEVNCVSSKLNEITSDIAKIFVNIFEKKYNIKIDIKEPNDLMLNGKKIGGILTESKVYANIIKYLVIGIGINTNKSNFNENISNIATSIKNECSIKVDRLEIISEFCNEFEKNLEERKGK